MTIRLKSPRVRVVLGDVEDESTWEEIEVQCLGRDIQATERMLAQLKLGNVGQNPITSQAMFGYQALRRTGQLPAGTTWADFENLYIEVTDPNPSGDADEVRPTDPTAGPES